MFYGLSGLFLEYLLQESTEYIYFFDSVNVCNADFVPVSRIKVKSTSN